MSFGVGIGDLITVINIGLDVYKKIKDREEPIIDIANRLKSLQRYLVPLKKDFVDTKNALTGL
jgi:nitrogen fixation protein